MNYCFECLRMCSLKLPTELAYTLLIIPFHFFFLISLITRQFGSWTKSNYVIETERRSFIAHQWNCHPANEHTVYKLIFDETWFYTSSYVLCIVQNWLAIGNSSTSRRCVYDLTSQIEMNSVNSEPIRARAILARKMPTRKKKKTKTVSSNICSSSFLFYFHSFVNKYQSAALMRDSKKKRNTSNANTIDGEWRRRENGTSENERRACFDSFHSGPRIKNWQTKTKKKKKTTQEWIMERQTTKKKYEKMNYGFGMCQMRIDYVCVSIPNKSITFRKTIPPIRFRRCKSKWNAFVHIPLLKIEEKDWVKNRCLQSTVNFLWAIFFHPEVVSSCCLVLCASVEQRMRVSKSPSISEFHVAKELCTRRNWHI